MRRKILAAASAAALILSLSGCAGLLGGLQPRNPVTVEDGAGGQDGGSDSEAEPTPSPDPDDEAEPDIDYEAIDQETADAISVIDAFWAAHFSEFYEGATYSSPTDYIPYVADDLPTCGGEEVVADNALYCIPDNTILWDQALMDYLYVNGGDAVIYLVIAHEWGHEIQAQLSDEAIWTAEELQADCFAGAALYGASDDGIFQWEDGDTAEITNALTFLADQTEWTDIDSHGDPLDRIDAFNDGRVGGVAGCYPVE